MFDPVSIPLIDRIDPPKVSDPVSLPYFEPKSSIEPTPKNWMIGKVYLKEESCNSSTNTSPRIWTNFTKWGNGLSSSLTNQVKTSVWKTHRPKPPYCHQGGNEGMH